MEHSKTSYISLGNVYIINGLHQANSKQKHIQKSRQTLRNSLQEFGFNVMVFAGPANFMEQLRGKTELKLSLPAVLLFDTRLHDWSSVDLQRELNLLDHSVPMIFLGDHQDYKESVNAMKQGAIDFWGSPFTMNEICLSVEKAMQINVQASIDHVIADELKVRLGTLTEREREICYLMVQGFGNIEIATRNGTTAGTVKVHRGRVLQKMKVANLAILVNQMGLLFEKPINTLEKNTIELVIANAEKSARAAELITANIELLFQTKEKSKRASELVIANKEKAARASELAIANIELAYQTVEKAKRAYELVIANREKAARASELVTANIELAYQTVEKIKRAGELVIANADKAARASELVTANIELLFETEEKSKRAGELIIANAEKASRASELATANIELLFETEEKSKRAGELVIANAEKAARASELATANIELAYQTEEKSKRAGELVIANADKAARASELATANIELAYQTEEKCKRAGELVIANEYEPALRSALLLMLKRALIQLRDRAQDDEKKSTKRIASHQTAVKNTITTEELEYLFPEIPC
jgi:FixJ family two-component response regulator